MQPELSRPWSQEVPHRADKALADLNEMHDECSQAQQNRRTVAFAQARRFIEQAKAGNGVGPTNETFPRKRRGQDPSARVDIEVKAGLAFVS